VRPRLLHPALVLALTLTACLEAGRRAGEPEPDAAWSPTAPDEDAGPADTAQQPSPPPPPPPACDDDLHEDNDRASEAAVLTPGQHRDLVLCPDDPDWFGVDVPEGGGLEAAIRFVHDEGDLDAGLFDSGGAVLVESVGRRDEERLVGQDLAAGRYLLRVHGYGGAGNGYDLDLRVTDAPPACEPDPAEDNDHPDAATAVRAGLVEGLTACPGEDDWYGLELLRGDRLTVRLEAASPLPLSVYRAGPGEPKWLQSAGGGQQARLKTTSLVVEERGIHLVLVRGEAERGVSYTLGLTVRPEGPVAGRLHGRVRFEDHPYDVSGFVDVVSRPARWVTVEAVGAHDAVVATGTTDEEGRYELAYEAGAAAVPVALRVLAQLEAPGGRATVRAVRGRSLHAVRSDRAVDPAVTPDAEVDLDVPAEESVAGAFNVLDVVADALALRGRLLAAPPAGDLVVHWSPGVPFGCGSCYADGVISLGGAANDPDEYDDPVIAHETAHFVASLDSRDDSPGGEHDGSRDLPALAWSEGYATFYGQWALGHPLYFDSFAIGHTADDVEVFDFDDAYGTSDDSQTGRVSECLVTALLWDLADPHRVAEPVDVLQVGDETLLSVFGYLPSARFEDRGARGVDLVDYLDGWVCHGQGRRDEVTRLLDDRRFPYDWAGGQEGCGDPRHKPRAPLAVEVAGGGPGEVVLRVTTRRAGVGLEVVVADGGSALLGPVQAGESVEVTLPRPSGTLLAGATLFTTDGARWFAPLPAPSLPPPRPPRLASHPAGGDVLEWPAR